MWAAVFLSAIFIVLPGGGCNEHIKPETPNVATKLKPLHFVLVGTLDGHIHALDAATGREAWQFMGQSDGAALLSSSITQLKLFGDDSADRLVPALDGGLYKWDGESLQPLPINAESLLSTSYRLSDRSVLVGGTDAKTYGVNARTGNLMYICGTSGCQRSHLLTEDQDLVVIRRKQQTVRAVEDHSGYERWNFSVGEYEITFKSAVTYEKTVEDNEDEFIVEEDIPYVVPHNYVGVNDLYLKVLVSDGTVFSVTESEPRREAWRFVAGNPVSSVWVLRAGTLRRVDLFARSTVPSLDPPERSSSDGTPTSDSPLVYLGMHAGQMYVQHSGSPALLPYLGAAAYPKGSAVTWRPYLVSASSRPALEGPGSTPARDEDGSKALVSWSQYNDLDIGYYLTASERIFEERGEIGGNAAELGEAEERVPTEGQGTEGEGPGWSAWDLVNGVGGFLSKWYKEALVTFSVSACSLYYIWHRWSCSGAITMATVSSSTATLCYETPDTAVIMPTTASVGSLAAEHQLPEFVSRFETDFQDIVYIGRGGFGVVFEATNSVDSCAYAVKRIALPDREAPKDRVLREVKTLAILDHPGIVRYFNSWLEAPPPGWIEHRDSSSFRVAMDSGTVTQPSSQPPPRLIKKVVSLSDIINFAPPPIATNTADSLMNSSCFSEESCGTDTAGYSSSNDSCLRNVSVRNEGKPARNDSVDIVFGDGGAPSQEAAESSRLTGGVSCTTQSVSTSTCRSYLYIQMQLCRKETLRDWLAAERDTTDYIERLRYFEQIVEAVQYVHDNGLIHRDLKPSNIFFSQDGTIKIGDFGLVTTMEDQHPEEARSSGGGEERHTDQVGTWLYMSPEQSSGTEEYGQKVDIFSLGLILFELCHPFSTQMERVHVLSEVRSSRLPRSFHRDLPAVATLVLAMVDPEPEARPGCQAILGMSPVYELGESRRRRSQSGRRNTSNSSSGDVESDRQTADVLQQYVGLGAGELVTAPM